MYKKAILVLMILACSRAPRDRRGGFDPDGGLRSAGAISSAFAVNASAEESDPDPAAPTCGICSASACQNKKPGDYCYGAKGEHCEVSHHDCVEDGAPNCTCVSCKEIGQPCLGSSYCCTKSCVDNTCACLIDGQPCEGVSRHCCSGRCEGPMLNTTCKPKQYRAYISGRFSDGVAGARYLQSAAAGCEIVAQCYEAGAGTPGYDTCEEAAAHPDNPNAPVCCGDGVCDTSDNRENCHNCEPDCACPAHEVCRYYSPTQYNCICE
jgi:hypothetical protein